MVFMGGKAWAVGVAGPAAGWKEKTLPDEFKRKSPHLPGQDSFF
jgi:hypothetical protein